MKKIKQTLKKHNHLIAAPAAAIVIALFLLWGDKASSKESAEVRVVGAGVSLANPGMVSSHMKFSVLFSEKEKGVNNPVKKVEFIEKGKNKECALIESYVENGLNGVRCVVDSSIKNIKGVGYKLLDAKGKVLYQGVIKSLDPRSLTLVVLENPSKGKEGVSLSARSSYIFDSCELISVENEKRIASFEGNKVLNPKLDLVKIDKKEEYVFARCSIGSKKVDSDPLSISSLR